MFWLETINCDETIYSDVAVAVMTIAVMIIIKHNFQCGPCPGIDPGPVIIIGGISPHHYPQHHQHGILLVQNKGNLTSIIHTPHLIGGLLLSRTTTWDTPCVLCSTWWNQQLRKSKYQTCCYRWFCIHITSFFYLYSKSHNWYVCYW